MSALDELRAGSLGGTRSLSLAGLGLREVPPELFALAGSLEVLDLAGNALTSLPPDMERLGKLKILFGSRNPFVRLPPVLGACATLEQIGFRGCAIREVPAEALPSRLRWLTLTDNRLETLPSALGTRPRLQKLMLAGNHLRTLPDTLAAATSLELLRIAANRFQQLPGWIERLPRLAWLAFSGNPCAGSAPAIGRRAIAWSDLEPGAILGEGASGHVLAASWRLSGGARRPVAIKLFKGAMTSDGMPEQELEAALAAGSHPHLVGAIGRISLHPEGRLGLVLPLLPAGWRCLAAPPNESSCSRDVYGEDARFTIAEVFGIARSIADAAAHLHRGGMLHGDLYAHNILWNGGGAAGAVLSDFGAATIMPAARRATLSRLDVLAWGILLGELLDRCAAESVPGRRLQARCSHPDPRQRPPMRDILAEVTRLDDGARDGSRRDEPCA